MILAICVVVDVSKCLGTLTLQLSTDLVHLPSLLDCKLILRLLLALRTLLTVISHPILLRPSFVMQTNHALWILQMSPNRPSQSYLEAPHGLCIFEIVVSTQDFWDDQCPSMLQNGLFFLLSVPLESPFFCSWLSSITMLAVFWASPIPCPLRLSHPEFSSLEA